VIKNEDQEALMETMTKEIAAVLRSTETMADQFAILVQQRVGQQVSHAEILAVMKKVSPKQLSMKKVVAKIRQQREK
jgi:oligoribonuclease NrnB/cAMP/cGMP phosphodiesterase (DHH superfamily)